MWFQGTTLSHFVSFFFFLSQPLIFILQPFSSKQMNSQHHNHSNEIPSLHLSALLDWTALWTFTHISASGRILQYFKINGAFYCIVIQLRDIKNQQLVENDKGFFTLSWICEQHHFSALQFVSMSQSQYFTLYCHKYMWILISFQV